MRAISRRAAGAVVLTMAIAGAIGGSAGAQESPSPAAGGEPVVFTIGTGTDIRTVNPFRQVTVMEAWVEAAQYESLIEYERETLDPAPGLATSWTQSEDGLTWTFKMRENAVWSDGEPITAHDFVWFANFVIDNDIGAFMDDFAFVDSITAQDDHTIIWRTTQPTFVPGLSGKLVLPEHVWGDMTLKEARGFENFPDPVVSGPFVMSEWEAGEFWTIEANPRYHGQKPHVDEFVWRVFNTDEAVVQALRRGTVDFVEYLPPPLFDSLEGAPGVTRHVGGATGFTNLNFNMYDEEAKTSTGHPALLDVNVRRAIAHAIDAQALIDKVLRGYAEVGTTIMAPAFPLWHYEPTTDERIDFDIGEANRILDQAGYTDTDDDGIREMPGGGEPLEFRLMTVANDSNQAKMAPFIQGWLKQIGIRLKPDPLSNSTLLDRYYDLDFDMYIYGWLSTTDPDFMLSTFTTDQCLVWSDTCWSDETYDQMYEQQREATGVQERRQIVFAMQRYIYEQAPEIVLWYDQDLEAYRGDRWTGFIESPEPGGYLLDQYTLYSMLSVRPKAESEGTAAEAEGGIPGIIWIGVVAALVVVFGGTALARRGRDEGV